MEASEFIAQMRVPEVKKMLPAFVVRALEWLEKQQFRWDPGERKLIHVRKK